MSGLPRATGLLATINPSTVPTVRAHVVRLTRLNSPIAFRARLSHHWWPPQVWHWPKCSPLAMRSIELSGGSDFDGTRSGCEAADTGSCCHFSPGLLGTV